VVAAERRGGEVLLLFDEGESYGVNRLTLGFPGTDREVLLRAWVDHVTKSRIDPTQPLFAQWADRGRVLAVAQPAAPPPRHCGPCGGRLRP